MADPENFGGGDFKHKTLSLKFSAQNLKNSDVFTEMETEFSAEIENSNVFSAQNQVVSKKKRSSPKLRLIFRKFERSFRPKSGGLQKKKGLHQNGY